MTQQKFQQKLQETLGAIALYNKQKSKWYGRDQDWLSQTQKDINTDIESLEKMIKLQQTTKDLIAMVCKEFLKQYKETKNPDHQIVKMFHTISKVDTKPDEVVDIIKKSIKCKKTKDILTMLVDQMKQRQIAQERYKVVLRERKEEKQKLQLTNSIFEEAKNTGDIALMNKIVDAQIEIIHHKLQNQKLQMKNQTKLLTYQFIEHNWSKIVGTFIMFVMIYFFYTLGKDIAEGIDSFAKYFQADEWFNALAGDKAEAITEISSNRSLWEYVTSFSDVSSYSLENALITTLSSMKYIIDPAFGFIQQVAKIGKDAIYGLIMIIGCLLAYLTFLISTVSHVSVGSTFLGKVGISMGKTLQQKRKKTSKEIVPKIAWKINQQEQLSSPKKQESAQKQSRQVKKIQQID